MTTTKKVATILALIMFLGVAGTVPTTVNASTRDSVKPKFTHAILKSKQNSTFIPNKSLFTEFSQATKFIDKRINGMPKMLRHSWYRGTTGVKITKHRIWYAEKGTKWQGGTYFKYAYKRHHQYTPGLIADVPWYKYKNGHMYELNQQGKWDKYHR